MCGAATDNKLTRSPHQALASPSKSRNDLTDKSAAPRPIQPTTSSSPETTPDAIEAHQPQAKPTVSTASTTAAPSKDHSETSPGPVPSWSSATSSVERALLQEGVYQRLHRAAKNLKHLSRGDMRRLCGRSNVPPVLLAAASTVRSHSSTDGLLVLRSWCHSCLR